VTQAICNQTICNREDELLTTIRAGRWPDHAGSELRDHVASCDDCRDLAVAADALFRDYTAALHAAAVPPSGAVWWRIQRRTRTDALARGNRMLFIAQLVAVAGALAAAIAIAGVPDFTALQLPATSFDWSVPVALTVMVCAAVAPVVLYLAFARD
jgi:predicted anti-sigma-YlaC factor YlaD